MTNDGMPAIRHSQGSLKNTPAEVLEADYPIQVMSVALRNGSGGPGRHRGGLGIIRKYKMLADCEWSIASERNRVAPWGLFSGKPPARARVTIERVNGEVVSISQMGGKISRIRLQTGDVLSLESPGGGGYGSPFWRNPESIFHDWVEGYISVKQARDEYGVVIDAVRKVIDYSQTDQLREEKRSAQRYPFYSFDVDLPEIREAELRAEKTMGEAVLMHLSTGI